MKHLYLTRKVLSALFLLVLAVGSVKAQYSTPTINGIVNLVTEYSGNNYRSGDYVQWYVTWDANNVYFAVTGTNTNVPAIVYIDSNPLPLVNGGSNADGNLTGQLYDGTNCNLPFRADRAIFFKDSYQELRSANDEGDWALTSNSNNQFVGSYAKTFDSREISIPWTKINTDGSAGPKPFNWLGYLSNQDNSSRAYGAIPFGNPAFGNSNDNRYTSNLNFVRYFTVSNVTSGNVNDTGSGTGGVAFRPQSSYTHIGGSATNFGEAEVYDFTMNTPDVTINRSNNGGDLNIAGSLKVAAGKVFLGTSVNKVTIAKDLIVYRDGAFDGGNAELTVADDFIVKGAFVSSNRLTLQAAGDTIQVPANTFSVGSLYLQGGNRVLTNNITVTTLLDLNNGAILNTGRSTDTNSENTIFLTNTNSEAVSLSERNGGYVLGNIEAKAPITSDITRTFSGIGLSLENKAGQTGAANPGDVTVRRITGNVIGSRGIAKSISRQFQITASTNANLKLRLQFKYFDGSNGPTELNTNDETNLKLFRAPSSTSAYQRIENSIVDPTTNVVTTTEDFTTIVGFYTLSDGNVPLPVELVAFTGKLEGSAVRLNWATASEKNNKGFEVQRNIGGDQWATLGFVAGHGSTSQRNAYDYLDANAPEGKATYRLRQLDNDGTESFSPVVTIVVSTGNAPALVLSPVPTPDVLNISGLGSGAHLAEVYDMMGKRVLTHSFKDQTTSVSVANLPSGLYVVQVQGKKSKFVKQ